MAALGSYLQTVFANFILGIAAPAAPSGLKIGLSCGDPSQDGSSLVEPVGGYQRQAVTLSVAPNPGGGLRLTATNALVFGPAAAQWGTVTHAVLFDQAGNVLIEGPLGVQRTPPINDTVSFGIGAIQFVLK